MKEIHPQNKMYYIPFSANHCLLESEISLCKNLIMNFAWITEFLTLFVAFLTKNIKFSILVFQTINEMCLRENEIYVIQFHIHIHRIEYNSSGFVFFLQIFFFLEFIIIQKAGSQNVRTTSSVDRQQNIQTNSLCMEQCSCLSYRLAMWQQFCSLSLVISKILACQVH